MGISRKTGRMSRECVTTEDSNDWRYCLRFMWPSKIGLLGQLLGDRAGVIPVGIYQG